MRPCRVLAVLAGVICFFLSVFILGIVGTSSMWTLPLVAIATWLFEVGAAICGGALIYCVFLCIQAFCRIIYGRAYYLPGIDKLVECLGSSHRRDMAWLCGEEEDVDV